MTRLEELEKILETVCEQYEDDCSKCPRQKECEEYSHIYIKNKSPDESLRIKTKSPQPGIGIETQS